MPAIVRARSRALRRGAVHLVAVAVVLSAAAVSLTLGSGPATAAGRDPASVAAIRAPLKGSAARLVSAAAGSTAKVARVTEDRVTELTPPPPGCPVPTSEFIDSWGFRRSGGRGHKGVDMMARHGDPIFAPVAGAIRPSNSSLGGIGFYLDAEDGTTYFGSHLASLDVTGPVEAGQQIGTVGSTGNASPTGPHLHFEVMLADRGSVNPYPFVAEWCAGGDDADDTGREAASRGGVPAGARRR